MAKELPYFRFTVQEWQNGKISLESYELQGLFMSICGYYWLQDCCLSRTLLCKKFRGYEKLVDELIELSILKFNKKTDEIEITFLNMQFDLLSKARQSKQKAGSIGGKQKSSNARAVLKQKSSYKDKDNDNDNNKDNNKDKDGYLDTSIEVLPFTNLDLNILPITSKKENTVLIGGGQKSIKGSKNIPIPNFDEFCNYAWSNEPKVTEQSLKLKYKSWIENNWHNGLNKPIKNWKSTLLNTLEHLPKQNNPNDQSKLKKNLSVLDSVLQTLNERENTQDAIQ